MSVFRPKNINRRLVGTATTSKFIFSGKGSPGNGGQIGPRKTPYCCGAISLGCRCNGGTCGGVFKLNESRCGVNEDCKSNIGDCGGFFICCGPSTTKWFVAPSCTQVCRNWYSRGDAVTVANSCMGSCGWFVPACTLFPDPAYCCRFYWDSFSSDSYWTDTACVPSASWKFGMGTGNFTTGYHGFYGGSGNNCLHYVRSFRCTT